MKIFIAKNLVNLKKKLKRHRGSIYIKSINLQVQAITAAVTTSQQHQIADYLGIVLSEKDI